MRIDVKKFLFIGPQEERSAFFSLSQEAGCIEFISPQRLGSKDLPSDIDDVAHALKILHRYPKAHQDRYDDLAASKMVATQALALDAELCNAREEERVLQQEIERIAIFGDFDQDTVVALRQEASCYIQFFYSNRSEEAQGDTDGLVYIGEAHSLHYFVAINKEPRSYPKMVEIYIEEPVGVLKERLQQTITTIHRCESALKELTANDALLREYLIYRLNEYHLAHAEASVQGLIDNKLFAIEGWVPVTHYKELALIAKNLDIHYEEIAIDGEDRVPTRLENKGNARLGEELIHIYDTPSIHDKDPSLWVLCAFALFFSMIVGDAGYGLVLLGTVLFFRYKFGKGAPDFGKQMLKLGIILGTGCIIWGVLTTSFFGMSIDFNSPLRQASLVQWLAEKKADYHLAQHDDVYKEWVTKIPALADAKTGLEFLEKGVDHPGGNFNYLVLGKFTDNIMMEIALLVGTLHVILSFARYLDRHWAGLGWILFMIGGYLFFPSLLNATSMTHYLFGSDKGRIASEGLFLLYSGIGLAVVISVIQKKIMGLLELQNLIQVFADILSYLRLYALALAGGIMSTTFNGMAESAGWIAGFGLIAAGHGINFLLSMMGGVIHGLRLNFLEWYHYSFEGGGRMLRPLARITRENS